MDPAIDSDGVELSKELAERRIEEEVVRVSALTQGLAELKDIRTRLGAEKVKNLARYAPSIEILQERTLRELDRLIAAAEGANDL